MDQWLPALVAAILGGTGLASIFTGGAQLTARRRIRHKLESLEYALSVSKSAMAREQLRRSVERESLQLASLSMARVGFEWILIAALISTIALGAAVFFASHVSEAAWAEWVIFKPVGSYEYAGETWPFAIAAGMVFFPWLMLVGALAGIRKGWVQVNVRAAERSPRPYGARDAEGALRDPAPDVTG